MCCALRAVWALCAVCTTCHMLRAGRYACKIPIQWRAIHIVPLNQHPPQMVRGRLAWGGGQLDGKLEYFQRWEAGQQVGDAGQLVRSRDIFSEERKPAGWRRTARLLRKRSAGRLVGDCTTPLKKGSQTADGRVNESFEERKLAGWWESARLH